MASRIGSERMHLIHDKHPQNVETLPYCHKRIKNKWIPLFLRLSALLTSIGDCHKLVCFIFMINILII